MICKICRLNFQLTIFDDIISLAKRIFSFNGKGRFLSSNLQMQFFKGIFVAANQR